MVKLLMFMRLFSVATSFAPHTWNQYTGQFITTLATSTSKESGASELKSEPRSGFARQLLNFALASPLWEYVLVPQARASIVKTAEGE